jgi:hypothetical protein
MSGRAMEEEDGQAGWHLALGRELVKDEDLAGAVPDPHGSSHAHHARHLSRVRLQGLLPFAGFSIPHPNCHRTCVATTLKISLVRFILFTHELIKANLSR